MNIIFTSQGTDWDSNVDPRFGRTRYFFAFDDKTEEVKTVDNRSIDAEAHGAGPKTAQRLVELEANVLITGNGPGGNAAAVLGATGIEIYVGAGEMTVKQALEAYRAGDLRKFSGA